MSAAALLAALALGIAHAPAQPVDCSYTVPVLALSPPPVIAGNMRTTDGGCLIWLDARFARTVRRRDVCALAAHETGHLGGLQHSPDASNVMHSPFTPLRRSFC